MIQVIDLWLMLPLWEKVFVIVMVGSSIVAMAATYRANRALQNLEDMKP